MENNDSGESSNDNFQLENVPQNLEEWQAQNESELKETGFSVGELEKISKTVLWSADEFVRPLIEKRDTRVIAMAQKEVKQQTEEKAEIFGETLEEEIVAEVLEIFETGEELFDLVRSRANRLLNDRTEIERWNEVKK